LRSDINAVLPEHSAVATLSCPRHVAATGPPAELILARATDDALTAIARQNIVLLERFVSAIDPIFLPAAANRALDHLALAARFFFGGHAGQRDHGVSASYFASACAYIAKALGDPFLSVEQIAEAIAISSGHRQQIFRQSSGSTVGEYVREQRLACCRRDLADACLIHQSITSIAFRWGFSESSSFSRAFRHALQNKPAAVPKVLPTE
jgi:AraC-like DNA-binding protein